APLMNERPVGAIHRRIVALAFAAWIFDFYDLILYSFLLVPVARELHLTPAQSSLALGTSLLMTALGGIIFGFLGDRLGRKPMIATTVAIYGLGTALCGFSHTLAQLILYRSITGLGMGADGHPGKAWWRRASLRIGARVTPPTCRPARRSAFCSQQQPADISRR
ncbi:MAG TPA: MFS transporter, partial [Methylomirabilota bacterium]|nr:MFS transporter [Methylomirabilota bacterium]